MLVKGAPVINFPIPLNRVIPFEQEQLFACLIANKTLLQGMGKVTNQNEIQQYANHAFHSKNEIVP